MQTKTASTQDELFNQYRIGLRVQTTGGQESGVIIGIGYAFGVPQVQVKFDREELNCGCEGKQAGQWVDWTHVSLVEQPLVNGRTQEHWDWLFKHAFGPLPKL